MESPLANAIEIFTKYQIAKLTNEFIDIQEFAYSEQQKRADRRPRHRASATKGGPSKARAETGPSPAVGGSCLVEQFSFYFVFVFLLDQVRCLAKCRTKSTNSNNVDCQV